MSAAMMTTSASGGIFNPGPFCGFKGLWFNPTHSTILISAIVELLGRPGKERGCPSQPEEGRQSLALRSLSVSARTETELKVIAALAMSSIPGFAPRLPRLFSNRPCSKAATLGPREFRNSTVLNMFSAPLNEC